MQEITDQLEASIIFEKHQNNLDKASEYLRDAKVYYRSWLDICVRIKNNDTNPYTTIYELEDRRDVLNAKWKCEFDMYRAMLRENLIMTINANH